MMLSKHRATPNQSLSLSRISHSNDSDSHNFSHNTSFGGSSTIGDEQVDSRTPSGVREGDTDDTMSDPTILGRSARNVRGGEQWFTTTELGSPSFSSPASASSMPFLEQPTASFEEGRVSSLSHRHSPATQQNSVEWSSYEEEQSSPTASMAYRGEIFAFAAAATVSEYDHMPPKTIAQGMQHPGRREALLREFDGHCKRRTWKIVDHPGPGVPVMQSCFNLTNMMRMAM